ncbi:hypothetical protein ZWY2020_056753 [Hordeum vulgare]|nr:hypothetical protein ZWY2020_056753 [Hordeum vulgare]
MDNITVAAANCRCSRVIYVGNIPFQAKEKEVRDACELTVPVLSFNLAADATTGKRKGYFIEYADETTVQSVCRNLHGNPLGHRELRVGLVERAGAARRRRRGNHEPVGMEDAIHAASLVDHPGRLAVVSSVTLHLVGASRN